MWLLYLIANLVLEKGAKTGNEPYFLQMFHETHKKGTEFATPEIVRTGHWSSTTFIRKYTLLMCLVSFFNDEIRDGMGKDRSVSKMEVGVLENIRQTVIVFVWCADFKNASYELLYFCFGFFEGV